MGRASVPLPLASDQRYFPPGGGTDARFAWGGVSVLSSRSMKHSVTNFVRALAVLLMFVPAPVAVLNTPAAVAEPAQIMAAEPAVVLPDAAEEEAEDPWTARYLAPVSVVLTAVVVGAAVSYYVVRIRGRYRPV